MKLKFYDEKLSAPHISSFLLNFFLSIHHKNFLMHYVDFFSKSIQRFQKHEKAGKSNQLLKSNFLQVQRRSRHVVHKLFSESSPIYPFETNGGPQW